MIEVVVVGLACDPGGTQVRLLLKEREGRRVLPIGIGSFEAEAIGDYLDGTHNPRPLAHDLLVQVLGRLDARVQRVEVSALVHDIFFAWLVLEQAGQQLKIDSRPSDAMAIALRAGAPIYVAAAVLDQAGLVPRAPDKPAVSVDQSRLSVFTAFIETLNTEDL